jgi:abelson tyrosine-protein kinase 1/abelson tyrosine-protein kinase 2
VWRPLDHENILDFLGASSTTAQPPYFLISPYMRHGNIVEYMLTAEGKAHGKIIWILEIALGMQYLHSRDVLHGGRVG